MTISIRGTAHPPAGSSRSNVADLNAVEIGTQRLSGLPLHVEHDTGALPVGRVQTSWAGPDGELRIAATVDDPAAEQLIRSGEMRGLSLGTEVVQTMDGQVLRRAQSELSVCEEPRRPGCYVDTVNGRSVHRRERFSKRAPLAPSPIMLRC